MKVVFDTNVFISAFASPHGLVGRLFDLWTEGIFDLVVSEYILSEFQSITKEKLGFTDEDVKSGSCYIRDQAYVVVPVFLEHKKLNPNDWPVLSTAIAGKAGFLVTGDKMILSVKTFKKIRIVSPRDFFEIVEKV